MFDLNCYLDVSEGKPGMLVPLFSAKGTNLPYVQQMDEFFQVREIVPFLEYENYDVVPIELPRSVVVGDNGLIVFRSTDNSIVCGDVTEVLSYISQNKELISKNPLLNSQLQRIEAAELNPSFEGWRSAAAAVFIEDDQRRFWIDSEMMLFQKQKKIWADIEPLEIDSPKTADGGIYASISEYGTEYLIRWLSNRSNFGSKDWTKVWHYVNACSPFDDRIQELALSWIFHVGDEDQDLKQTRSILFALLGRWKVGYELPDLGEYLSSRFASDESLVYSFLRPRTLFADLFSFLCARGDVGDVLKIVKFAINELPKDEHVVHVLQNAVSAMYDEFDVDEKQNATMRNMWDELERIVKRIKVHA